MSSSLSTFPNNALGNAQTFEFTKRKRWADLLITELADTCIFILSSTLNILYCSPAVNELLGWREGDIIEHHFTDLLNAEDQRTFRACFEDSLRRSTELLSYVRLKSSSPDTTYPFSPMKEILFEIKGYHRYVTEDDPNSGCQCFFAMAKPYLGRNVAMLNTMMELQLENEHLQSKLRALKMKQRPSSSSNAATTSTSALYSTSPTSLFSQRPENTSPFYVGSSAAVNTPVKPTFDVTALSSSNVGEEEADDGQKKKKQKKMHSTEQYVCVTCGRTDSPEWRKGPHGPKTLCNACGLRWAKQMRKADDPAETGGESTQA